MSNLRTPKVFARRLIERRAATLLQLLAADTAAATAIQPCIVASFVTYGSLLRKASRAGGRARNGL